MELIKSCVDLLSRTPDWVFCFLVPALVFVVAVAFIFAPKRRWYFCVSSALVAAGFLIVYTKDKPLSVYYLCAAVVFNALCCLLFLIRPKKREKKEGKTRQERMYEKFKEELSEKPYAPQRAVPPKVCCFEKEEAGAKAEEYGMSLSYAVTLLKKLRQKKLNVGDRLETEELSRRLDCYREKPLTSSERSTLNDCLASILKLTAKYQL